jgi:tRNA pseudouridine38-40 synthase
MYRYFAVLSYKGTTFHGWQLQDNAVTVQSEFEHCLGLLLKDEIKMTGCGRTDTGVHARAYVAHFDYRKKMNPDELQKLIRKMNLFLPDAIVLHNIEVVDNELHARFSATERTYKYFIARKKNPFLKDFAYEYSSELNLRLMQLACKVLRQYDDFTSFSKTGGNSKTNNCKVRFASWEYDETGSILVFTICADRFLRNMVRAIVGTMLDVGREKVGLDDLRKIIESRKRSLAGASIEAKGLFLWDVKYEGFEYHIPSMLFLPHSFDPEKL